MDGRKAADDISDRASACVCDVERSPFAITMITTKTDALICMVGVPILFFLLTQSVTMTMTDVTVTP